MLTCESGWVVASVDYRLAPENPAPAAFDDAYAAYEWLAANRDRFGAGLGQIAVGGDSAGGGLATAVAQKARDKDGPKIAHQVLVYPAVDRLADSASAREFGGGEYLMPSRLIGECWQQYIPNREMDKVPYILGARAASLSGLPPATVILAECDPLYDQGVAYASRLREDGVQVDVKKYEGMIHGFFSFTGVFDKGREAVRYAAAALQRYVPEPSRRIL